MSPRKCSAMMCGALILPSQIFCERHDRMLQSDVRALLGKHFRPGEKPSKVFQKWLSRAREEILAYQLDGHRAPRAAAFDFDDERTESV